MKIRGIVFLSLIVAATLAATCKVSHAQTPLPPPRIPLLVWDDNVDFNTTWPAGDPLAGQSFLREVRVVLTPAGGGTPVISTVPIGQVEFGSIASTCPGGAFPCRKIRDLATPFGTFTVTILSVDRKDRVSEPSNGVPFSGTPRLPAQPAGVRIP